MDRVHHNLNTGEASVRLKGSTKVSYSAAWVEMVDAVPNVQKGGQRACVKRAEANGSLAAGKPTGRAVHAFVKGTVIAHGDGAPDLTGLERVHYNPFRSARFEHEDGTEWLGARRVIVTGGYVFATSED